MKQNSQSTACTSRGEMPSRGAAALKAASSCPGDVTPSGKPAKPSAVRSAFNSPGVIRRKPVGVWAKPPLWRPLGAIFLCHRDPPFWLDRDGQAFPVNGNGNFRLTESGVFWLCWGLR